MEPYIFISYAHKDSNKPYGEFSFDRFTNDLQDSGFNLWIDTEALRIGEQWDASIKDSIRKCEVFFLIVTENAANSEYTRTKEVVEAQKSERIVVPIIVEKSALSKFAGVDATQGVDFTEDYRSAFDKLSTQYQHLRIHLKIKQKGV